MKDTPVAYDVWYPGHCTSKSPLKDIEDILQYAARD